MIYNNDDSYAWSRRRPFLFFNPYIIIIARLAKRKEEKNGKWTKSKERFLPCRATQAKSVTSYIHSHRWELLKIFHEFLRQFPCPAILPSSPGFRFPAPNQLLPYNLASFQHIFTSDRLDKWSNGTFPRCRLQFLGCIDCTNVPYASGPTPTKATSDPQ